MMERERMVAFIRSLDIGNTGILETIEQENTMWK